MNFHTGVLEGLAIWNWYQDVADTLDVNILSEDLK